MITEAYSLTNSDITNSDILTSTPNIELMTPNGAKNKNLIPRVPNPLAASFSPHTNASTISTNEALHIIMQRIGRIQEDIKTITENQLTLYENQNTLLLKFTEYQTQCQEFTKLSCEPRSASKISDFEPIGSANELDNLEISLKDPDFSSRLTSKLEVFCGKGKNRGISNAYAVIDALFQRKFLTNCSWTGGSRTDDSKIALKGYKNVFNLLFSVCHASDPNFNKPDCEKFLKTVLKNARQRCNSKRIRVSTVRRRQKRKNDGNAATSKRSRQLGFKESNIIDKEVCTTGPSTASDNDNTTAEEEDSLC
ncbi:uncharacterized protein LOC121725251 isoform X2 [Aricia agestis]|nr:uncharacterized protein LOC121725251 isoform X2 [Aricia agestis]XP_041968052.1 uncharacterized protein LOC121725251 isoform X2 [Aricia agestis]